MSRLSMPYFWNPSLDVDIRPLELSEVPAELNGRPTPSERLGGPSECPKRLESSRF